MTIHLFILEALVCASMYMYVKLGGVGAATQNQRTPYTQLYDQVQFLSQLFSGEFIFPTQGLDKNLGDALSRLESDKVITITRDGEGKIDYVEVAAEERESGRENYDFFCFLIWPFVEASWLGAVSLMILTPPAGYSEKEGEYWLEMSSVQNQAQKMGKTLYHQGDLSYFEAVNKETLRNAYTRFEEEGIILVTKSRDAKVGATVRLAEDWIPPRSPEGHLMASGKLWTFAELISQSRREGKNRRDGQTVKTRVVRLADLVGKDLYRESLAKAARKEGKVPVGPSDADAEEVRRKERRRKGRGTRWARL